MNHVSYGCTLLAGCQCCIVSFTVTKQIIDFLVDESLRSKSHERVGKMSSPAAKPSMATKASWASLTFCFGCMCLVGVYLIADHVSPHARSGQGVLLGLLARVTLVVGWVAAGLTALVGIASLLLIRKVDIMTNAVYGIVGRGVFGAIAGLLGSLVLWLVVGHVVIGF